MVPPQASPGQAWLEDLERAGWSQLADRLIHGICHSLNGRITALSSVLYFLESPDQDISSMASLLEPEIDHLQEAEQFLRLLLHDPSGPVVLVPGEVLPVLARTLSLQRGLEETHVEVQIPPETPGVRVERALFVRSMLLLLSRWAEMAAARGRRGVGLAARGEEGGLNLFLEVPKAETRRQETDLSRKPVLPFGSLPEDCEKGVEAALRKEGIQLEREEQDRGGRRGDGITLRLRFPPP